jgi:hypothetical protein
LQICTAIVGQARPRQRALALHEVLEVVAGEVLHHDVELAARQHADVVGAHDVVALDLHHRARLLQAALDHVGLVGEAEVDQLDRQLAAGAQVRAEVHPRHPA